jgi:hypothetical protein
METNLDVVWKRWVYVPLLLLLSGCALTKKFRETTTVNFTPFATQTLVLLGSLDYEISPNEAYIIVPYADPSDPSLASLRSRVDLERTFLKGIMSYSIEIVNLSESHKSETDQVKDYTAYLSSLVDTVKAEVLADVEMSDERIQSVLSSIRKKETLLEAMREAKPLIVEFNKVNLRLIRDIGTARTQFAKNVHAKMDETFKTFLEKDLSLRAEKSDVLKGLGLIRAYRLGDPTALNRLGDIRGLPKTAPPADAARIENALSGRLTLLTQWQKEIDRDIAHYHELKIKLEHIKSQHDEMIRSGGRAVLLWSQAHQKMASGITNPAEWFGLSDAKSMLTGAAKKVLP